MNSIKNILAVTCLLLFSHALRAQTNYNYALATDYSMNIQGGSNLHGWTEKVGKAEGSASVHWNDNGSFDLNNLELLIKANSITSSEGFVMNNKTYKALNAAQYPTITFVLTSASKSLPADGKEHELVVSGRLTVAGLTQPVALHAMVKATTHGTISFEGSQPMKMSDYRIDPPTALFGTLKVTNDVSFQFKTKFIDNNH